MKSFPTKSTLLLKVMTTTLCTIICASTFAQSDSEIRDKGINLAQQTATEFQAIAEAISIDHFDYQLFAESLDLDIEQIINHVTHDISYVPYLGSMRAQSGTLAAGSGSAWDQAILLASLIHASGGEARLAKGRLNSRDAVRLIATSHKSQQQHTLSQENRQTITKGLEKLNKSVDAAIVDRFSQRSVTGKSDDLNTVSLSAAGKLETFLNQNKIPIGQNDQQATQLLQERIADDYVWVEYREMPGQTWSAAHPAFASSTSPEVTAEQYFAGTVPEEYLHQVEISLDIEVKSAGHFSSQNILPPLRLPVSQWQPLNSAFSISPGNLLQESDQEATFFVPLFNGEPPQGAKGFTLDGQLFDAREAMSGPALFTTLADKMSDAFGDQLGGDKDQLTGVLLSITHIAPGGKRYTELRRLSDFRHIQPKVKTPHIINEILVNVSTGKALQGNNVKSILQSYAAQIQRVPIYADFVNQQQDGTATAQSLVALKAEHFIWSEFVFSKDWFDLGAADNALTFRTGPLVATKRLQVSQNGKRGSVMDITHNDVRALLFNADKTQATVSATSALLHGVKETLAEQLLMSHQLDKGYVNSAFTLLADADAIRNWLPTPNPATIERMLSDMQNSGVLIALNNSDKPRWWRVNPETGQTLGMTTAGGSEANEYAILTNYVNNAIGMAYALYGAKSCSDSYPSNKAMQACCQAGNVALTAIGGGIGSAASLSQIAPMYASLGTLMIDVGVEVSINTAAGGVGNSVNGLCEAAFKN